MRRIADRLILTVLAAVLVLAEPAGATSLDDRNPLDLTAQQRAWLSAHPVIRLGVDPDFAPYAFIDAQGRPAGVSAELTALVGERLGVKLVVVPGLSWPRILEAARQREIDVITTATYRPERLEYLNFTRPYLITPLVVMTRVETPHLNDLQQLNRMKVALVRDYASTRTALERFPGIDPVRVDNPLAGLNALSDRRADAYIGVLGINTYLASRNGISNLKVNTGFDMSNSQSYGVRKDWPELVALLEKALDSIPAERQQKIFARWIPVSVESIVSPAEPLDAETRARIAALPVLRVGALGGRPPFDFVGQDGRHAGLSADVIRVLAERGGFKFSTSVDANMERLWERFASGELDLVLGVNSSAPAVPVRALSEPYFVSSLGVFVRKGDVFLGELSDLLDRRVAVRAGGYAEEILGAHPRIALQAHPDLVAAAKALRAGKADFVVNETTSALRIFEQTGIADLRYAGPLTQTPVTLTLALNPRRADLPLLVNKALSLITPAEAAALRRRWVAPPLEAGLELRQVLPWTAALLSLVGLGYAGFITWNRRLRREIARRTETERAAREFSDSVLATVGAMVVVLDADGRIVRFNKACEEITGYSEEEARGHYVWDFLSPTEQIEPVKREFQRLAAGEFPSRYENDWLDIRGERRRIAWSNSALTDPQGEVEYVIASGIDISERKQAQAERERVLAELRVRNAEMENFVYTISHDLKTPVITIGGFATLLERDMRKGDTTAAHDSLGEIRKAAQQMTHHIQELLFLSRLGQVSEERHSTVLGELIDSVLAAFAPRLNEVGASVRVLVPLSTLVIDRKGFARVFNNLIDNAIKYRRPDVALEIEIGATHEDGEFRIYTRDNGQGIKQAFQSRIFGMFQRADSRTEGAGVGLAISKRVVEVHGGRMWVESEPGVGSTFWIGLSAALISSSEEWRHAM